MSFLKDDGQPWPEPRKYEEPCEFCGAGLDEDCRRRCPTRVADPLGEIGIPKEIT